jgi:hypothetical protein
LQVSAITLTERNRTRGRRETEKLALSAKYSNFLYTNPPKTEGSESYLHGKATLLYAAQTQGEAVPAHAEAAEIHLHSFLTSPLDG